MRLFVFFSEEGYITLAGHAYIFLTEDEEEKGYMDMSKKMLQSVAKWQKKKNILCDDEEE